METIAGLTKPQEVIVYHFTGDCEELLRFEDEVSPLGPDFGDRTWRLSISKRKHHDLRGVSRRINPKYPFETIYTLVYGSKKKSIEFRLGYFLVATTTYDYEIKATISLRDMVDVDRSYVRVI